MTDPLAQFDAWLVEARASEPNDSNAMALATVGADGQPSVRMVLLKGHDARGFVFYTNLESRKAGELIATPKAACCFTGSRCAGRCGSKARSRPSRTMRPMPISRRAAAIRSLAPGRRTSRARWRRATFRGAVRRGAGALRRVGTCRGRRIGRAFASDPERIEFWQDRAHRLHERRLFTRTDEGWTEGLLYP
jgi:pyridoxamine 5'-phosphate oxidase